MVTRNKHDLVKRTSAAVTIEHLYGAGGIRSANYITGPTYLLNWGIETVDRIDHKAVRAESIAFTEMILRLGRTPRRGFIRIG